jgi:aryl-alcohol dehydrogenase-like predicted oxidoreductase
MKYPFLGNTGMQVSDLCFGTMSFGGVADKSTSKAMFEACREAGINFFDCADVYEQGKSEEILGDLIQYCRDEVVITSKVYFRTGKDINAMGASRYHIVRAIEGTLRRLRTDYIDLYFIHRFDNRTPLEETLSTLNDLVRQGKVLYLGLSNFAAWQVAKAMGIAAKEGWANIACIQPMYNLVKRQAEVEILPMAISENIGVISYSPLGGGLLTGKYLKDNSSIKGRLSENEMYQIRYGDQWMQQVTQDFVAVAKDYGYHPVSLAIAWVQAHPGITAPIIGARNVEQLKPCLDASSITMTEELYETISNLSYQPPLATDRNEELTEVNYGLR